MTENSTIYYINCGEKPRAEHRRNRHGIYVMVIFCLIMAFLIPYLLLLPTPELCLKGRGYEARVNAAILPVNRYRELPVGYQQRPTGLLIPSTAGGYSVQYSEDFESGSTSWVANTASGIINGPQKYVLHGAKSYYFSRNGNCTLQNVNFTIASNESLDFSFYTIADSAVLNGYYSFTFNATFNTSQIRMEFVISQGGSGYPVPSDSNIINRTLTGFWAKFYTGFIIQDIRTLVSNVNNSAFSENITISNLCFILWESNGSGMNKVYLDYIQMQLYPVGNVEGYWYQVNTRKTDYFLTFNYSILADANVLDIANTTLQLVVFENVTSISATLINRLFETAIISGFNWTDISQGIYNKGVNGSFNSIMHPFPRDRSIGETLTFEFSAQLSVIASTIDTGEPVQDSITKSLSGFTISFKKPIQVT